MSYFSDVSAGQPLEFLSGLGLRKSQPFCEYGLLMIVIVQVRGIEGCLTASSNADGAPVVFHDCTTLSSTMSASWTVVDGGSSVGTGPAGQIQIFGDKVSDCSYNTKNRHDDFHNQVLGQHKWRRG